MFSECKTLISTEVDAFRDGFNGVGIYMLVGLFELNHRMPFYIGSSSDLRSRIRHHISALNGNKHNNQIIQHDWNKYGKDMFIWICLEETSIDNQYKLEQYYFDLFQPFAGTGGGYNFLKSSSKKEFKYRHSDEIKLQLSIQKKGESNPQFGKKQSLERRSKIAKKYSYINSEGKIISGINKAEFCKLNGLDASTLNKLERGELHNYKGWRIPGNASNRAAPVKTYSFISPSGEVHTGENIKKFADSLGFYSRRLSELMRGDKKSYKGWKKH